MEPQQPLASQPNTAPDPAPPVVPSGSPQPITGPTPSGASDPAPSANRKKGKLRLILGIIGIVVVILLVLFLFALPNLQAGNVSNSFMHDITTGDTNAAAALTDGGTSNSAYLQEAAKSVSGGYSVKSTTVQANQHYYLYTLSNSTNKYARTIVKKETGGWKITSFVFSATPLTLVPTKSAASVTSTSNNTQSPSTSPSAGSCLTASDFSFFSNLGMDLPTPNVDGTYSEPIQLQFTADQATYDPGSVPDPSTVFSDFKNFYSQDAGKRYIIELESSVNSAAPDEQLANARNAKVQSDLESISGIPASKITIQPITNDTSGNSGDAFYRQVQINLSSAASCATS